MSVVDLSGPKKLFFGSRNVQSHSAVLRSVMLCRRMEKLGRIVCGIHILCVNRIRKSPRLAHSATRVQDSCRRSSSESSNTQLPRASDKIKKIDF